MIDPFATEDELRELLVARLDILTRAEFDDVAATARRLRVPIERAVVERARVPVAFLLQQLAESWNIPFVDLRLSDVQLDAMRTIPEDIAKTRLIAAFARTPAGLRVAAVRPRDPRLRADLQQIVGTGIDLCLAPARAIRRAHLLYDPWLREILPRLTGAGAVSVSKPNEREPAATFLATKILEYADLCGASDIHIEPYEFEALVRYRTDGVLQDVFSLTPDGLTTLVARFKVLAGMRVDEKRAPQDGRFGVAVAGEDIDLRVSIVPTHWGEKIVMRVLSKEPASIDLDGLGLVRDDHRVLMRSIFRPFGMILVTGPTGSGKTTTLYATLARLAAERQGRLNICTIEDPIERPIARVSQIAVNPTAGIDFAGGLRALLRQDPDVIMVGEIRDHETAEIAVRSALVGRLLLSTLHTNDAASAVPRLIDMGIEPFLLASTLELVIAQRLARRICMHCRESTDQDAAAFESLRRTPAFAAAIPVLQKHGALSASGDPLARVRLFRGRGCGHCHGTGFRGRVGVFELLHIDDEIRALIVAAHPDSATIRASAVARGMKTMFEDGLAKVFLGETTLDEVQRATA